MRVFDGGGPRSVLAVVLAVTLAACGGGDSVGSQVRSVTDGGSDGANGDTGDGGSGDAGGDGGGSDDGDDDSDDDGEPPLAGPFRWDVSLAGSHQPACVLPGRALPLSVAVYDRNDEPIPDPQYQVESDVAGALEADGSGGWIVHGEGETRLTVTYSGATEPDASIAPVVLDLLRDGTPPDIAIHQPARGAMLTAGSDVRVQGQVTDATSPVDSVVVNGLEQPLTGTSDETIDATPPGQWGLNVIDVVASDRCGNRSAHSQSYLRSEDYRPAATAASAAARVVRGQTLRLTQPVVDDLDRSDIDDFATLAERYLQHHLSDEVSALTSGAVIASAPAGCPGIGYSVSIRAPGATLLGPRVREIELLSEQMRQELSAERVNVPLRFVQVTRTGIPLTGCLTSTIDFNASLSANVTSDSVSVATIAGNGQVDVTLPALAVELDDVRLALTGNNVVDNVLSSLLGLLTSFAEDAIEETIASELPPLIEAFLNTPLTAGTTVSAGPFDTTLNLVAGIDGIGVAPVATTESAYTQVYPGATATPYPGFGAIARPTEPADLAPAPGPVTYAIDDNLTNQGFWTLWHGGALEIPDIIGFPGAELQISGLLPPVLMPGTQPDTAMLGIGDLAMTLRLEAGPETLPPLTGLFEVEAYVTLLVDGGVAYDAATQQLRLSSAPEQRDLYVHIERVTDGMAAVTDPATLALLEPYAARLMAGSAEQLADETLVSVVLPALRVQLEEPAAGGTVEGFELDITGLTRAADHLVISLDAVADGPPGFVPEGYLRLNNDWALHDALEVIPPTYALITPHKDDPDLTAVSSQSITIADYRRTRRPQCDAAGNSAQGDPICLAQWKFPLNYGWYCGVGRPVIGFLGNPRLDPVDYCCRLHDRNLFDPLLGAKSPHNACGFLMCLSQATGHPAEITQHLPDVERARRQMYNKAALLCGPGTRPLPELEIVPP